MTRLNRFKATTGVLLLLLIAAASATSRAPEEETLPNFHQVNENLYRGAQPRGDSGIRKLKTLGVRTVINLRGGDEGTGDEEAQARAAGLNYFNVPMDGLGRPSDEKVEKILS